MDRIALFAGLLSIVAGACTADKIKRPMGEIDAGPDKILDPPAIEAIPPTTPLDTVAIRGTTDGSRVVSQGANQTVVTAVLPGGSFCQDVPLSDSGATSISIYAVGGDGRVSEPIMAEVTRDLGAAEPANARCSGSEEPDCADAETCGNETDDDCNGFADDCDLTCSGCIDDEYEPNDFPSNVPTLLPGTYSLQLCPCRDDWIAFAAEEFDSIRVTATFNPGDINLNLRLYRAGAGGNGTGDLVVGSFTTTGTEEIDHTVEEAGTYYLHIYPLGEDQREAPYTLTIE